MICSIEPAPKTPCLETKFIANRSCWEMFPEDPENKRLTLTITEVHGDVNSDFTHPSGLIWQRNWSPGGRSILPKVMEWWGADWSGGTCFSFLPSCAFPEKPLRQSNDGPWQGFRRKPLLPSGPIWARWVPSGEPCGWTKPCFSASPRVWQWLLKGDSLDHRSTFKWISSQITN